MRYHSFHPGRPWLDTAGKRIQAHGGSVLYWEGAYYWYGENKEKTDGKNGIWHWGVRCYRSTDLYNWEDLGLIIPPDTGNEASPLHPTAMMDRPHILFNGRTGKFVCWLKIMNRDGTQASTVLTADTLTGPYQIVRTGLLPLGMSAGDFDLALAPDGRAYYYFEHVHSETICAELNEDYTDVTGVFSSHFAHSHPPYVREATAHFMRRGRHYLLTSGTTGYLPNPSEAAVAEDWHGPFTVLGDPHVGDGNHTSFHSQISSVFRVHGKKDLYIACADRWLPRQMGLKYADYAHAFDVIFNPASTEAERDTARRSIPADSNGNTSIADYVWLPIRWEREMPRIDWRDEWRLDEFESLPQEETNEIKTQSTNRTDQLSADSAELQGGDHIQNR